MTKWEQTISKLRIFGTFRTFCHWHWHWKILLTTASINLLHHAAENARSAVTRCKLKNYTSIWVLKIKLQESAVKMQMYQVQGQDRSSVLRLTSILLHLATSADGARRKATDNSCLWTQFLAGWKSFDIYPPVFVGLWRSNASCYHMNTTGQQHVTSSDPNT